MMGMTRFMLVQPRLRLLVPGDPQAHLRTKGRPVQRPGHVSNASRCRAYSVLPRVRKVPMMPLMSEDSPRTIKDYYALVTLQRHHIGNPPESDERIEVVVRIPEEVAKTLAGGG